MSHDQAPGRWAGVLAAIGAGLGGGLLGTSLHGHAIYSSTVTIPVGALAALLLLASLELFVGLWTKNVWTVVFVGGAAYLCCGIFSLQRGGSALIANNLQGNLWLYGIAITTPLLAWGVAIILRRTGTPRS